MSEAGNQEFADWARRRMSEMGAEAEGVARELGLPPDAKFAILSDLYPQSAESTAAAGQPVGWSWLISALFPLQARPGLMAGDGSTNVVIEGRHQHQDKGMLLSVKKSPASGGATVDLEVEVTNIEGTALAGLAIGLLRPRQPRLEEVTDEAGHVRFRGLLNTRWRDWMIEVARLGG